MVRFSKIQQFPDYLKTLPGNFRASCRRFEISEFIVEWKACLSSPEFTLDNDDIHCTVVERLPFLKMSLLKLFKPLSGKC